MSIWKYQEVVEFACGISKQPVILLEVIYNGLITHLNNGHLDQWANFLQSLRRELPKIMEFDVFHNQYFNYSTTDDPTIYVPNRFYKFDDKAPEIEAISIVETDSAVHSSIEAHCSISVSTKALLTKVLKVLQKIQERMKVVITSFIMWDEPFIFGQTAVNAADGDEETTKLLKTTLKLGPSTVLFHLSDCYLSQSAYKYIAQQLHDCRQMQSLCLRGIWQMVPVNLGESIKSMTELKICNMERSMMTATTGQQIMLGLSACRYLEEVCFLYTKLANTITDLFDCPGCPGFEFLITLDLTKTKLSENDVDSIARALNQNKLPHLKHLILSSNRLTSLLGTLMLFDVGYPFLEMLNLEDTGLTSPDITSLSQAIRWNKMPKLKKLNIAQNKLNGRISDLFGEINYPRLSSLEELNLAYCYLKKDDLKCLFKAISTNMSHCKILQLAGNELRGIVGELFAEARLSFLEELHLQKAKLEKEDLLDLSSAIEQGKLKGLLQMSLQGNNFQDFEDAVEHLFKTCAAQFRRERIEINMSLNDLSNPDDFIKKIHSVCSGTNVSMNWSKVTEVDGKGGLMSFGSVHCLSLKPGKWHSIPIRLTFS